MASKFSDNLNKTIATGYNVFGQTRAIANALGLLEKRGSPVAFSTQVASEIRKNGIARPTYAYSQIVTPAALFQRATPKQRWGGGHTFLTYRNDSFSIPGIGLTTTDIKRFGFGPTEKKPNGVVYQDVTFNYILDTEYNQHKFFYDWLDIIVAHSQGLYSGKQNFKGMYPYEVGYKEDYATTIDIMHFDEKFDRPSTARLLNVYPTSIGDIQYNWSGIDTLIRLPVTFTYSSWDVIGSEIKSDLNVTGGPQSGLFGNLLKVGTALQALSTIRNPRNIQDVVNIVNVTKTLR